MIPIGLVERPSLKRPIFAACFVFEGSWSKGLPWADYRLLELARNEKFEGKKDQALFYQGSGTQPRRLMIIGLGKPVDFDLELLRRAACRAARAGRDHRSESLVLVPPQPLGAFKAPALAAAAAEGAWLGLYKDRRYLSKPDEKPDPKRLDILASSAALKPELKRALDRAAIACQSVLLVRDLVNTPPSELTPEEFARRAAKILRGAKRVRLSVFHKSKILALRMGGLLGVSRGSDKPPVLLHLRYRPAGRVRKNITLVGKGITFDSGGLSLKSASYMEDMKSDMAGAASVLGIMLAASRLNLPVEINGVAVLTENMPGPSALKPGDVLYTMSGKTVEVLNTDAEGRLILADALFFGSKFKGDVMIDMATLTGAAIVALGAECTALMGDQKAVDALKKAGQAVGEKSWQLPLIADYKDHMKSRLADLKNTGKSGQAGTIIGGLFLKEFAGDKPWVHMDIAGPSFLSADSGYQPQGGTGIPVRTLIKYLEGL
jgi:leucyl aminopeptidase